MFFWPVTGSHNKKKYSGNKNEWKMRWREKRIFDGFLQIHPSRNFFLADSVQLLLLLLLPLLPPLILSLLLLLLSCSLLNFSICPEKKVYRVPSVTYETTHCYTYKRYKKSICIIGKKIIYNIANTCMTCTYRLFKIYITSKIIILIMI